MSAPNSEEWRPVVGWEGLYEVSSHGRVRSLDRLVPHWKGGESLRRGRIMSLNKMANGRFQIHLTRNSKSKPYLVHRLVCEAFNGSPEDPDAWVLHADDDPSNNTPENLRWGTPSENAQDTIVNGNNPNLRKEYCPKGHPYRGGNLYVTPRGHRRCRRCIMDETKSAQSRGVVPDTAHGTPAGYSRYNCKCQKCRGEKNRRQREYRKARRAETFRNQNSV